MRLKRHHLSRQPPANRNESPRLVHAAAKTTGQPAPYYQRKALLLRWLFSIASFTKQGFWNGLLKEAKTISSENSTLAAPAAKETQCHYHRRWHRCWCHSHWINSRNLLPLLPKPITGLSGSLVTIYIYILVEFVGLLVTLLPLCYCYYESILYGCEVSLGLSLRS